MYNCVPLLCSSLRRLNFLSQRRRYSVQFTVSFVLRLSLGSAAIFSHPLLLSGVYSVLFGLAIWVLPRKFNVPAVKMFFFPAIITLFVFATLNIAFNLVLEMSAILVLSSVNDNRRLIDATV